MPEIMRKNCQLVQKTDINGENIFPAFLATPSGLYAWFIASCYINEENVLL